MKTIIKNIFSIIFLFTGIVNAQNPEYLQQIEQWDDSLYLVTISDFLGRCKTSSLLYGDPENLNFVLNENTSNVIDGDDFLEAKMWTPYNSKGIKPYDVCYNPDFNKIYVYGNTKLLIINSITKQIITSIDIYAYMEDETYDKRIIARIDRTSNTMTDYTIMDNPVLAMYYNSQNNLYVHFPYSNDQLKMVVKGYDCTDNKLIDIIETGNIQKPGIFYYNNLHRKTPYSIDYNKLFFGNLGFANVSAIKIADEKLQLNSGYRWLSFPRMPSYAFADDPYSTVSVFENNISYYPQIDFTLESQWDGNKQHDYEATPPWSGPLDNVQSTLGYKLNIAPIDGPPPTLNLHGARLDPNFSVSLPNGNEAKWIGYFIKDSQFPWQAFPTDVYNNKLQSIKAQYWSMYKDETKGWTVTGKVTPIKYGDMLIVRTNQPGPINFQWNNPDESVADVEVPNPAAFSWEELADYTPFFIETDANTDIEEIAVMVDGECMGATVVQPGDTLVEVDGYFGDIPAGSTVEFETWNGFKSSPVEKGQYIVYNPLNGRKEKRNIYTGERRDYYRVSFKQGERGEIPSDICDVSCQPNPFDRLTTLSMRLNRDQKITVKVFDINGVKIKTLINRNMTGGYYEIPWAGDNETEGTIKRGVYFYKITSAEGSEITGKIVKID